MPYNRPLLSDLQKRVSGDLQASLKLSSPILKKSVLGVLSNVFAGTAHSLYGFGQWLADQLFPDTAESAYLDRIAGIWGITRKAATFSSGNAVITGSNGAVVPSGTIYQDPNNNEYQTTADAIVSNGTVSAPVEANFSGSAGNIPAGTVLNIVNPIAGIVSQAAVDSGGFTGGVNTETDDALRSRLIARIQNPPHGGDVQDYIMWALAVPGVTRAWAYANWMGVGTIGVTFVMDNNASGNIIPDANTINNVINYINTQRPLCAQVYVFAPVTLPVNFTIHANPNTAAVQNAVTSALQAFIAKNGYPGNTMYLSQIDAAISSAAGEIDNVLSSPSSDVSVAPNQISVFGGITWD
jgi:uncharacterized phage protein gp47/JayE